MNEASPSETAGQDLLARKAVAASMKLFSVPARQYAEQRVNSGPELVDYMRRKQSAETAESHYVTAESRVPGLCVGSVVKIDSSFYQSFRSLSRRTLGEFIITEIVHEVGEDGYYRNRFKALPSALEVIPVPDARIPHAETQMATVTRNDDPRGSGRIQVRMNWQADDMNTNWIRVMTPDGGSSSDVKSNRGFVFIPEVGDHVLVGFRHGDPSRPYAMGSLFNGFTGKGGGKGNNCKSLTSRSGSSLKLDDSAGSVTLHDKGGVSMNFDGAGNATTNAKSSNFVNAGTNNVINVGNGSSVISSDSDGNITLKGNTAIILSVGENQVKVCTEGIFINGKQQVVIGTDETMSLQAKQDMTMSSKTNLNMSGKTTASLGSKDISITGGSKVVVDGPDVNINS